MNKYNFYVSGIEYATYLILACYITKNKTKILVILSIDVLIMIFIRDEQFTTNTYHKRIRDDLK